MKHERLNDITFVITNWTKYKEAYYMAHYQAYLEEHRVLDWDALIEDAKNNYADYTAECAEDEQDDMDYGNSPCATYLFSALNCPSGKYYTPYACSNIEHQREIILDAAWFDALDQVASEHDGWIESGEGDPLDLFFAC